MRTIILLILLIFFGVSLKSYSQEIWVKPGYNQSRPFVLSRDKKYISYCDLGNILYTIDSQNGNYQQCYKLPPSSKRFLLGYDEDDENIFFLSCYSPNQNILSTVNRNTSSIDEFLKIDSANYTKVKYNKVKSLMIGLTSDYKIIIWDLKSKSNVLLPDSVNITFNYDFDVSKDGIIIYLVKSDAVYMYNTLDGKLIKRFHGYNFNNDKIAVGYKGNLFIKYTSGESPNIRLYDTSKSDPVYLFNYSNNSEIAFSQGDKFLLINDGFKIIKIDIESKKELCTISDNNFKFFSSIESLDDNTILCSGFNIFRINISNCLVEKILTSNSYLQFLKNNEFLISPALSIYTIHNLADYVLVKTVLNQKSNYFYFIDKSDYMATIDTNGVLKINNVIDNSIIDGFDFKRKLNNISFSNNLEFCTINYTEEKKSYTEFINWKNKEIICKKESVLLSCSKNGKAHYYLPYNGDTYFLRSSADTSIGMNFLRNEVKFILWDEEDSKAFILFKNSKLSRLDLNSFKIDKEIDVDSSFLLNMSAVILNDSEIIFANSNSEIYLFNINNNTIIPVYNKLKAPLTYIQLNNDKSLLLIFYKGYTQVLLDLKKLSKKDDSNSLYTNAADISPIPASDYIEINVGTQRALFEQIEIMIYNVLGEIHTTPSLRDTPHWKGGEKVRIDVSGLAPGMYFVRIGNKVSKFVKV